MSDVYFVINDTELYLDFMLEDINDMPFFYVCKDNTNAKYLVLCTDFDNEEYFIVRITLHDLKDMLRGKMDIRNAFLEKTCWNVRCMGNTYEDDVVTEIMDVPGEYLPEKGAKYVLLDKEHVEYAERIEDEYETMLQNINMVSYQGTVSEERAENASALLSISMDEEYVCNYIDKKEYQLTKEIVIMAA